ncbi:MAG: hypothetical protein JKY81_01705 [Colwellia sp.]|nr:hypothetical protein [Colwellia sp.]
MSKYTTLIDGMELAKIPAQQILDAIKHMEAATKPAKKVKAARKEYLPDFEVWWQQYPDKRNNTKSKAADEWEELDATDKQKALLALTPYRKQLKEPNAPSCIHAERFLKYRRFDSFDSPQISSEVLKIELDIEDNKAHWFLNASRFDGASESDIRYWKDKFRCEKVDGQELCVVIRELGDFDSAFGKTVKRLGYSVWTRDLYERKTA